MRIVLKIVNGYMIPPELLERLKASGDIAPVLSTTRIGKYRVVFYIWQDGKTPLEKIGEGPESCRELTEALRVRIESLLRKEQGLHGIGDSFTYPEEGEFLYTPR